MCYPPEALPMGRDVGRKTVILMILIPCRSRPMCMFVFWFLTIKVEKLKKIKRKKCIELGHKIFLYSCTMCFYFKLIVITSQKVKEIKVYKVIKLK